MQRNSQSQPSPTFIGRNLATSDPANKRGWAIVTTVSQKGTQGGNTLQACKRGGASEYSFKLFQALSSVTTKEHACRGIQYLLIQLPARADSKLTDKQQCTMEPPNINANRKFVVGVCSLDYSRLIPSVMKATFPWLTWSASTKTICFTPSGNSTSRKRIL